MAVKDLDWPSARQVCRIERTTHRNGETQVEIDYAITSVPRDLASALDLLDWWRGHWGIENRLHWVRGRDLRGRRQPHPLGGALPNSWPPCETPPSDCLRSLGVTNIAAALHENACKVDDTLTKLAIPIL